MTRNFTTLTLGLLLMALAAAGCADGERGDEGKVAMQVRVDAGITGVTLTGIGINVSNAVPDPETVYRRDAFSGSINWSDGSSTYSAQVVVRPIEGDEGLLPAGTLSCCPPLVATQGETGAERGVVLMLVGDEMLVFERKETVTGS